MSNIFTLQNLDGSSSSNSLIYANELDGGISSTSVFVGEVSGNSSEQQIKNRISSIVKYHVPEFVRSDFSKFTFFIEAYYKFLEQDFNSQEILQNIQTYADIDKTASQFVYYFLNNYAKDLPVNVLGDKRLLIKRINDLYTSKGSSLSFDILFRVLFDSTVTINHPYENVLTASGGTWTQKSALGLKIISGDKTKLEGRFLNYTTNNAVFETPILGYKDFVDGTIEVSLDKNNLASSYTAGDFVFVYNTLGEEIFKGQILTTLVTASVLQAGTGFRIGQIFNVNFASNTGILVKVTKVSSVGGIEKLKFINFGYGYPNTLTVNLNKDSTSTNIKDAVTSSTRGAKETVEIARIVSELGNVMLKGNITLSTSINRVDGFGGTEFTSNLLPGDFVTIVSNVYTVQNVTSNTQFYITSVGLTNSGNVKGFASATSGIYFSQDYVVTPNNYTGSFFTNITDDEFKTELPSTAVPADFASVNFTSGALAQYPGSFTTNKGFLSEDQNSLQDDLLYQPFAYQTNTEVDIDKFYDTVIRLIHPAGQRLFNNRNLNNIIDVSANVSTSTRAVKINSEFHDSADPSDLFRYTQYINFTDSVSATDLLLPYSFNKVLEDLLETIDSAIPFKNLLSDAETSDTSFFSTNIVISDSIEASDILEAVGRNLIFNELNEAAEDFSEANVYTDSNVIFSARYFESDYDLAFNQSLRALLAVEEISLNSNTTAQIDSVSQTDSGSILIVEDGYANEDYFESSVNNFYTTGLSVASSF